VICLNCSQKENPKRKKHKLEDTHLQRQEVDRRKGKVRLQKKEGGSGAGKGRGGSDWPSDDEIVRQAADYEENAKQRGERTDGEKSPKRGHGQKVKSME